MRIELHIERLVLDGVGVSGRDADAVRRAVASELSRLFAGTAAGAAAASAARTGAEPRSRWVRHVLAPPARLGSPADPAGLGRGIADSLHRGIAPRLGR
jgi:hypothetical protein